MVNYNDGTRVLLGTERLDSAVSWNECVTPRRIDSILSWVIILRPFVTYLCEYVDEDVSCLVISRIRC